MHQQASDSFAIFRLPHQGNAQMLTGKSLGQAQPLEANTNNTTFVISTFNNHNKAFAIPAGQLSNFDPATANNLHLHYSKQQYPSLGKEHYISIVEKAISEMNIEAAFEKVVLSRVKTIAFDSSNLIALFETLMKQYPGAFVYLVSSPETGTWLGASPELLLSATPHQIETVALAGTLPNDAAATWSAKEYEEQQLVEVYIEAILKELGLAYQKNGPANLITGNIKHLQTQYKISCESLAIASGELLSKLNPTSAVAGLPKDKAIAFIEQHEAYPRNFYSGFAGLIAPDATHLFVNLRCMEIQENTAHLFAGAGITTTSDAGKEFIETERKMDALLRFIGQQ